MNIIWATDIHHPAVSGEHYRRSGPAFQTFVERLRGTSDEIDLVAISGDLVNRGSARKDDLELFSDELDSIGVPWLVCPGNHDLAPSERFAGMYPGMEDMEPVALEHTNFGRVFGVDGLRQTIRDDTTGWRIIAFALRDEDPDGQIDWLASMLAEPGPVLVFGHYPVFQSREGGFCAGWGYARIGTVRDRLMSVLGGRTSDAAPTIYCCGHQHINSVVKSDGVTQVVTGALGNSPYCYRSILLNTRGCRIETQFLPGYEDWFDDAMNPDKSTDSTHLTPEEYHRGCDAEQLMEISW